MGSCDCSSFGSSNLAKYAVVVGMAMMALPAGVPMFYGNLSLYSDSYFISTTGIHAHPKASMWLITMYITMLNVSVFLGGFLVRKIGSRPTLVLGVCFFNASLFASYFAIQVSYWALVFTLGICGGAFYGILYAMIMLHAVAWFPNSAGVALSVGTSAFSGGAFFLNLLITLVINPENKAPHLEAATSTYFTHEEILSRVPRVFVVLGLVSTVCQTIAVILLKPHPSFATYGESGTMTTTLDFSHEEEIISESFFLSESFNGNCHGALQRKPVHNASVRDGFKQGPNVKTWDIFSTSTFYKMLVTFTLVSYGLNVENNFYKQFGMLIIRDDLFVTFVGIFSTITCCIFILLWGFVVDRIGANVSFIIYASLHACVSVFWFFTPIVSPWLYLFCTLAIHAIQSATFVVFPVMTIAYYGRTHYVTNYGAIVGCGSLVNVFIPPVVDTFLLCFGYFWLFLSVSLASIVCSALSLTFPPSGLQRSL